MLAVLLLLADVPTPDASLVPTLDLATITVPDARRLAGQRVRVAFAASTLADGVVVEAEGPDDESRTVEFAKGVPPGIGERVVVEGVLSVRCHKATVHEGQEFKAFVEVRVVAAWLVKP